MNRITFEHKVIIFFILCGFLYLLQYKNAVWIADQRKFDRVRQTIQTNQDVNRFQENLIYAVRQKRVLRNSDRLYNQRITTGQVFQPQISANGEYLYQNPRGQESYDSSGHIKFRPESHDYLDMELQAYAPNVNISDRGRQEIARSQPVNILTESVDVARLGSRHYAKKFRRVPQVNCMALFNMSKSEIRKANSIQVHLMVVRRFQIWTNSCMKFKKEIRGYILDPLTEEEKNFPIAFSILMYKDVEQVERLLRAIYRPQNTYCIHIDSKSETQVYEAMKSIVNCFDNVFIAEKRINVIWGQFSVLEPEIICMHELWKRSKTWKYFINLTGQEFPLRTNYELVKILKAYNGSNDVEASLHRNRDRWERAPKPPHDIIPTKGAVHIAVSRGFVDYALHDPRAIDFLKWTKRTKIPDETFFSTLNHNPHLGVPGSYKGVPETTKSGYKRKPFLARFKNRGRYLYNWHCSGKRVRGMCIFGHADLWRLARRKEMFANKFYLDYQPFVYGCLEELNFNRTRDEYLGIKTYNANWYSTLGFVQNKID